MITRLYLKGFIPSGFCGITEIEYTPKSLLQIIIGTNGSGKSSLLRALSLVPLDKKEFHSGGCRELECHDNGKDYRMVSHYKGSTPHHEFWLGDKNLNPGGTSAVQKQLVESHFGYTAFHHKLLTGKLQFTEMSPNARKDLLIMISGLDLEFAIGLFDKLRVAHRDIQGALKHLRTKYADAAKQLASMQNTDDAAQEARALEEELRDLLPRTNFSAALPKKYEIALELDHQHLVSIYGKYLALLKKLQQLDEGFSNREGSVPKSLNTVRDEVAKSEHAMEEVDGKIKKHLEEHHQLEEQAARFANVPEEEDREHVQSEIKALYTRLAELKEDAPQDVADLTAYLQELMGCHSALLNYMEVFPEKPQIFPKQDIEETNDRFAIATANASTLKAGIQAIKQKIMHAEAAREGNKNCPSCKTEILAEGALSLARIDLLKQELAEEEKKLEEQEAILGQLHQVRQKQQYFVDALKHIREIATRYPQTRTVFATKSPSHTLTMPLEAISLVHAEHLRVKDEISRQDLKKTIAEKELVLSLMEVSGKGKILARFKQVEQELTELYQIKAETERLHKHNCQVRDILAKLGQAMQWLKEKTDEVMSHSTGLAKAMYDEEVNNTVRTKQTRLANLHKIIHDYSMVETKLAELDEEEKALSAKKANLELLMHCLSPNKGFVGEQLLSVIAAVSKAINETIEDVWEKELKILVPDFGTKLDFQFMTQIEGLAGPDIKDLSAGQKEIVNFAMTLVVMRQLDLTNFPLLLDETSANMDSLHRSNFMKYIRDLVDNGEFRSIFLVSHYASEYGGFTNADVVVMNPDNIGVPTGAYNENIALR